MPEIPKKYLDFLNTESKYWEEEGIISPEQSAKILGMYEADKWSLTLILFIAGAVMIGLGGVSFALAHWHDLPKILRVCMILGGYLASLGAHIVAGRSATKSGRAFLLLAGIIFGAGIYLITRMYDYKLEFGQVLGWWLVHLSVTALCTRDEWQVYFTQAVSLVYLNWINSIDIFALEFMGSAKISLMEFFTPWEGFAVLCALWVLFWRVRDRAAFNVNMLLTLLVLASRMSLCFGGTWTLVLLGFGGAGMSFASRWDFRNSGDAEVLGLLVMGLCGLVLTWPEVWRGGFAEWRRVLAVVSALLTAGVMLVNIWRGHGAVGVIFCVLLIVRYFFDRLFGYIPKAWGFGLAGLAFLVMGIYTGSKKASESPDLTEKLDEDTEE
ncbi:MAG: DUF2157 domain-containing protein [Synergistaceae bacterium]|nr:DUF2157 domain-containing protein [Synergistaceae bacterium]